MVQQSLPTAPSINMTAASSNNVDDGHHQHALDISNNNNSITATPGSVTSSSALPCFAPEQATTAAEMCDQYQQILQEHIRLSHKYLHGSNNNESSMPMSQHADTTTTLSSAMIMTMRRQRHLQQHDDLEEDCSVDMSMVSNDSIDEEGDYNYEDNDDDVLSLVDSYFDNAEVDSVVVLRRRQIQHSSPTVGAAAVTPTNKNNDDDDDSVHFDFEFNDTLMEEDDNDAFGSIMAAQSSSVNTAYSFDLAVVLQEEQGR